MPDQITQDNQQPDPAAPAAAAERAASVAVPTEHMSALKQLAARLKADYVGTEHWLIDELHALVSKL